MSLEPCLLHDLSLSRPRFTPAGEDSFDTNSRRHALPPVLIRVPTVRPAVKVARRPSASASAWARENGRGDGHRTRRRRLRREVRLAGYLAGTVLPIMLAVVLLARSPAAGASPTRPVESGVSVSIGPPVVSLTIDSTPNFYPGPAEAETSVILPGYLLPDDPLEDSPHAGG